MSKSKAQKVAPKNNRGVPIDKLLAYWIELSKRPTLTYKDFLVFLRMVEETLRHFGKFYGWDRGSDIERARDKFYAGISILVSWPQHYFKNVYDKQQVPDREYALMKDVAKKFVSRIKKHFGQQLTHLLIEKTPFQDAADLISSSSKLTYRWAAGIIASNQIASLLIHLSNYKQGERYSDDIKTLYANLKQRTASSKLRRFLLRSYRRFEDADKTRNRCAMSMKASQRAKRLSSQFRLVGSYNGSSRSAVGRSPPHPSKSLVEPRGLARDGHSRQKSLNLVGDSSV